MRTLLRLVLLCLLTVACTPSPPPAYSFFVAGHSYGKIGEGSRGLYPPFRDRLEWLQKYPRMSFGVLTGDIVRESTDTNWDLVDADLKSVQIPVHFAPGNHDLTDRDLYEKRYGKTYSSFEQNGDLFLLLDPGLDQWNISGEQLEFVKAEIKKKPHRNVFIFLHQVLWWLPKNSYAHMVPNSLEGRAQGINFWNEVAPLLVSLRTPVYLFAGDVGARGFLPACGYGEYENLTFITSGMGGGARDNLVVVEVDSSGKVRLRLVALSADDPDSMGKLEDYNGLQAVSPTANPISPSPSPRP